MNGMITNRNFNKKNFALVKKLYWEEGWDYADIAETIKCNPSSIGRILNGIYTPIEDRRSKKKEKYISNYKAPRFEAKQARSLRCKREKLHSTKLTLEKAKDLRKSYFAGEHTQVELSKKYGVNQSTICKTIQGDNWKICKC
jgi:hypothetical protein